MARRKGRGEIIGIPPMELLSVFAIIVVMAIFAAYFFATGFGGQTGDASQQCGTAGGTEIYTCAEGSCPTGATEKPNYNQNCAEGYVCCYSPSSP